MQSNLAVHSNLQRVFDVQVDIFPEHRRFLERRLEFADAGELKALDDIAGHILKLTFDHLPAYASDYAWLCERQIEEELDFRRSGRYRLSTFEEAFQKVYSNAAYMTRYMNGLLLTQLWWSNHTAVMRYYRDSFLARQRSGYRHLEIGPGHGLFLYFAAANPAVGSATAWDVSEASIAMTSAALRTLGLERLPDIKLQDLFAESVETYDTVVFSEVLEHMEAPDQALERLRRLLTDDGLLFLNMPINSPAPDHLFNVDTPEDLCDFVEQAGFSIVDRAFFPATNQTLERSRRKRLTISCVIVAKRST